MNSFIHKSKPFASLAFAWFVSTVFRALLAKVNLKVRKRRFERKFWDEDGLKARTTDRVQNENALWLPATYLKYNVSFSNKNIAPQQTAKDIHKITKERNADTKTICRVFTKTKNLLKKALQKLKVNSLISETV